MNKNPVDFLEGIDLNIHKHIGLTANSAKEALRQLEMHEKQIRAIRDAMTIPKINIPTIPKIDFAIPKIDSAIIPKIDLGRIPKVDFGKISMDKINIPSHHDILAATRTITKAFELKVDIIDSNVAGEEIKINLTVNGEATPTVKIYEDDVLAPAPKIARPPGHWMTVVGCMFTRRARELILEPNLADYRTEYYEAIITGNRSTFSVHVTYIGAFVYDVLMALVNSFRAIRKSAD